ncbi:MAG: response regulator [Methylacidiphilales bacterium]|nr:response regulator [Candidatus Methylacidiphilales bacterium]
MHILLIDDSSSTRSLLRTLINSGQSVRHEISEAASGEESLQKVASGEINLPDLIIMDINMGGMSGYELCREFRAQYGNGSDMIPYIIIVTANEGVDVINQALESGANDYMPKPVNVKVLQVRLRVAERLLALAHAGGNANAAQAAANPAIAAAPGDELWVPPGTPAPEPQIVEVQVPIGDPRHLQIGAAIELADAPIVLIDASGEEPGFQILYANYAFSSTTQFDQQQLLGRSLAELEAWTPEFLKMVLSFVGRDSILSHVPLWSHTRQSVPVHLSFYPVHAEDESQRHYLIIHHF